jgi:hypothetical protein
MHGIPRLPPAMVSRAGARRWPPFSDLSMNIGPIDWIIVVVYLVGVMALGCWAGIVARRKGETKGESEAGDYFMAAHTLKWPVIGLALFATNISCVHLVSLAQSGYDTGLLDGNFEWMAAFTLILLGFFFAPFYLKSKVATLPDFFDKRYCRECRDWLEAGRLCMGAGISLRYAIHDDGVLHVRGLHRDAGHVHAANAEGGRRRSQSLYWRYPLEALEFPGWRGLGNYKVLAGIVILAMTSLCAIFRCLLP